MKKKLCLLLLIAACLLVLCGCSCEHEWIDADCTTPKTCSKCEEIEGAPLGHSWLAATCAAPKTCENCGQTQGETLAHTWKDADCTNPKTCSVCGAADSEALGHVWLDATYELPKTCSVCAATEGTKLLRTDLGVSMADFEDVLSSSLTLVNLRMDYVGLDEDNWPTYYVTDTSTGEELAVVVYFEPGIDGKTTYSIMVSSDVNDQNAVYQMGVIAGVALILIDSDFDVAALQTTLAGEPVVEDDVAYYSMVSSGLLVEMYVTTDVAFFWISPAE